MQFFVWSMCLCLTNRVMAFSTTPHRFRSDVGLKAVQKSPATRRFFLISSPAAILSTVVAVTVSKPDAAQAKKFILNEVTGEYDEVAEEEWKTTWKGRLDKMQTMSTDEILMAGRGAANRDLVEGEETAAQRKRRALAGCRDDKSRKKANVPDTKVCTQRVLGGDLDFMLDKM